MTLIERLESAGARTRSFRSRLWSTIAVIGFVSILGIVFSLFGTNVDRSWTAYVIACCALFNSMSHQTNQESQQ